MKKAITLLSVDWDYFVPEKPEWDMGHNESLIYLQMLWTTRLRYLKEMQANGEQVGFWKKVEACADAKRALMFVSDSHCHVWQVLNTFKRVNRVVLFDAHHDCFRGRRSEIGCGNWGAEWLAKDKEHQLVWVKPDHSPFDLSTAQRGFRKQIKVTTPEKFFAGDHGKIVAVHACRSGCWTPPWTDEEFTAFVKEFRDFHYHTLADAPWDGITPRWTPGMLAAYVAAENNARESLLRMKTFTVGSGAFAQGLTEEQCVGVGRR